MAQIQTNITPPRVPVIDARTGAISREWYMFFLSLFKLTGGGTSSASLEDLQLGPVYGGLEAAIEAVRESVPIEPANALLAFPDDLTPPLSYVPPDLNIPPAVTQSPSGLAVLPTAITVGASPFIYTNASGYNADVIIQGAAVMKVEFSRDGTTFFDIGVLSGIVHLSPWDAVRVTYTVAPTMTLVTR